MPPGHGMPAREAWSRSSTRARTREVHLNSRRAATAVIANSSGSLYHQVQQRLRDEIASGRFKEGDLIPFETGQQYTDCLDEIERAKTIFRQLGRDYIVADLTDPRIGFPVAQVIVPGYSDILPYHPRSSQVLYRGWDRNDIVGYYDEIKD